MKTTILTAVREDNLVGLGELMNELYSVIAEDPDFPRQMVETAIRARSQKTLTLLFSENMEELVPSYNKILDESVGEGHTFISLILEELWFDAIPIIVYSKLGTYGYYASRDLPLYDWLEQCLIARHEPSIIAMMSVIREAWEYDYSKEGLAPLIAIFPHYAELLK